MNCCSWIEVEKLITCAYCKKIFVAPYSLICCHTFCELCIKHMYSDFKKCPSCPDNQLIPLKVVYCENLYLTRLTTIFRNREFVLKRTCLSCKTHSNICIFCYSLGCIDCISRKHCINKSTITITSAQLIYMEHQSAYWI